jgi:hypothetical protein
VIVGGFQLGRRTVYCAALLRLLFVESGHCF